MALRRNPTGTRGKNMSNFDVWLIEQAHRDDAIGDLSRDFIASGDTSIVEGRLGDDASRSHERSLGEYAAVAVFA